MITFLIRKELTSSSSIFFFFFFKLSYRFDLYGNKVTQPSGQNDFKSSNLLLAAVESFCFNVDFVSHCGTECEPEQ